ncbi:Crp/Fnr family transcriptional regulator [Niveispirillum fermenti]|uniref:Crp/Fnr family transcriptional regulator n=1 Tax=Niveispirillum fermenti TaxID=1233113 RepID=UPI003A8AF67E
MKQSQIDAAWRGIAACQRCGIRHLVLFADLREEDFDHIHAPIEEMRLEAGAQLYGLDDPAAAIFTVRDGLLKLVQFQPDGSQRIVRLVRMGGVAGLEALLQPTYAHMAIALQPLEVCRIPVATIHRLQANSTRLHTRLMEKWHEALTTADGFLTGLSTGSARQRMARLLLLLSEERPEEPVRLFTREDLGSILAVTLETASRTISEFKKAGALREAAPNRMLCDREKLTRIAAA